MRPAGHRPIRNLRRDNTELLVIVTPELVQPIPATQKPPALNFPKEFLKDNSPGQTRTPGTPGTALSPVESIPFEKLIESQKSTELNTQGVTGGIVSPLQSPSSSQSMPPQPPMTTTTPPAK